MAPEARIASVPSPNQPTHAAPEADSSVPNRITPTETTACDQGIVQQRQQTLSNPHAPSRPPRSPMNQRKLPLTPLGYELASSPRRRCRDNPSGRPPLSSLPPTSPDSVLTTAFHPAAEPPLASENRAPPLENEPK